MKYIKTVKFVNNLLLENNEWTSRYKGYSDTIIKNMQKYIDVRRKFQIKPPLYLYTSISKLIDINTPKFDLRFLGQSIATIKFKRDDIKITTTSKNSSNLRYFGINVTLRDEDWNGSKARKFRSEFNKCKSTTGHSKEHKIESGLLSEFYSKSKSKKSLSNIQPVLLANTFFQMATPLKASSNTIDYSSAFGGGIDILARVKHKDNSVKICVMELKDENTNSEPPQKVMKQAVAYATFIANLLRSESGNEWYKIFGFSGNVPEILTIDVATVMPSLPNNELEHFNKERIKISENTFIELYSLYFTEKSKYIDGYNYEFKGSLKEEMMK